MLITVEMQDEGDTRFYIDPMAPVSGSEHVVYPAGTWSPGARKMVAAALRIAADQVDPNGYPDGAGKFVMPRMMFEDRGED